MTFEEIEGWNSRRMGNNVLKFVKHLKNITEAPSIAREIHLLKSIRHPSIVPILNDFRSRSYHCIVLPDPKHGSLNSYLSPPNRGWLNPDQVRFLAFQVLHAMAHIHVMGFVHCDIKPANILVHGADARDLRIWLSDFSFAKSRDDAATFTGIVGTDGFCSPESNLRAGIQGINWAIPILFGERFVCKTIRGHYGAV
jgi:serine/threonine protein kinase